MHGKMNNGFGGHRFCIALTSLSQFRLRLASSLIALLLGIATALRLAAACFKLRLGDLVHLAAAGETRLLAPGFPTAVACALIGAVPVEL